MAMAKWVTGRPKSLFQVDPLTAQRAPDSQRGRTTTPKPCSQCGGMNHCLRTPSVKALFPVIHTHCIGVRRPRIQLIRRLCLLFVSCALRLAQNHLVSPRQTTSGYSLWFRGQSADYFEYTTLWLHEKQTKVVQRCSYRPQN